MEKRFKSGMSLGKFKEFHKGHELLIQSGIDACEKFTILVCSLKSENIPGIIRYKWMKQTFPNANVVHVTEELPQYPEEHPDFWNIWKSVIERYSPTLDVMFASEDYGKTLGDLMGINHIIVDKERKTIPISGTAVRNKPITNWDYISEAAKPYFVKRFVFIGPESVGKTEMCKRLSKAYDTVWVPEYGRQLYEERNGILDLEDFPKIALQQSKNEEELCQKANKILICDTDNLITGVFAKMYFPDRYKEVEEFFEAQILKTSKNYSMYFLLTPEVASIYDGTRLFLEERWAHFRALESELIKRKLPFNIIIGTGYKERILTASQEINSYLKDF